MGGIQRRAVRGNHPCNLKAVMPYYQITNHATNTTRLVNAPTPAQALRHVARDTLAVKAASADAVVKLMQSGVVCEVAKAEPKTEPQPEGT